MGFRVAVINSSLFSSQVVLRVQERQIYWFHFLFSYYYSPTEATTGGGRLKEDHHFVDTIFSHMKRATREDTHNNKN